MVKTVLLAKSFIAEHEFSKNWWETLVWKIELYLYFLNCFEFLWICYFINKIKEAKATLTLWQTIPVINLK